MIINPYIFGQPLLLDLYPNAAVAYSVRKLRTAYSGAALRVRRSSDNAESDIGFVSNQLDTASLLSFVGAGNGFVTTWYDQSGNGNNATQTVAANQPRIVNAGTLETISGKTSIQFDGSNDNLYSNFTDIPQPISTYFVTTKPSNTYRFIFDSNNNRHYLSNSNTNSNLEFWAGSTGIFPDPFTSNTRYLFNTLSNGANSYLSLNNINFNGNIGINNLTDLYLGSRFTNTLNGNINMQEFIIYPSNQTSNRNLINTNINSYFNIYP